MSSMPREESILKYILANPGCYLRQIKKAMGIEMGTVQWYLNKMERKGQIWSVRHLPGRGPWGIRQFYAKEKLRLWGPSDHALVS
jgi:hypothetical protein